MLGRLDRRDRPSRSMARSSDGAELARRLLDPRLQAAKGLPGRRRAPAVSRRPDARRAPPRSSLGAGAVKIHRGSDAIGSWAFRLLVSTEAPIEEQWHEALTGLRACAEELCARGILLPTEATVERWREFRAPDITTTTRDLSATLLAELEALIDPAPKRGVLELNGDTRFDALDGPRCVPGACELGVTVDFF
jgi:hypothetical protein